MKSYVLKSSIMSIAFLYRLNIPRIRIFSSCIFFSCVIFSTGDVILSFLCHQINASNFNQNIFVLFFFCCILYCFLSWFCQTFNKFLYLSLLRNSIFATEYTFIWREKNTCTTLMRGPEFLRWTWCTITWGTLSLCQFRCICKVFIAPSMISMHIWWEFVRHLSTNMRQLFTNRIQGLSQFHCLFNFSETRLR